MGAHLSEAGTDSTVGGGTCGHFSARDYRSSQLCGLMMYTITGFALENSFEIHVFCLDFCLTSKIAEFLGRNRSSESGRKGLAPGIWSQYPSVYSSLESLTPWAWCSPPNCLHVGIRRESVSMTLCIIDLLFSVTLLYYQTCSKEGRWALIFQNCNEG